MLLKIVSVGCDLVTVSIARHSRYGPAYFT